MRKILLMVGVSGYLCAGDSLLLQAVKSLNVTKVQELVKDEKVSAEDREQALVELDTLILKPYKYQSRAALFGKLVAGCGLFIPATKVMKNAYMYNKDTDGLISIIIRFMHGDIYRDQKVKPVLVWNKNKEGIYSGGRKPAETERIFNLAIIAFSGAALIAGGELMYTAMQDLRGKNNDNLTKALAIKALLQA